VYFAIWVQMGNRTFFNSHFQVITGISDTHVQVHDPDFPSQLPDSLATDGGSELGGKQ